MSAGLARHALQRGLTGQDCWQQPFRLLQLGTQLLMLQA